MWFFFLNINLGITVQHLTPVFFRKYKDKRVQRSITGI